MESTTPGMHGKAGGGGVHAASIGIHAAIAAGLHADKAKLTRMHICPIKSTSWFLQSQYHIRARAAKYRARDSGRQRNGQSPPRVMRSKNCTTGGGVVDTS